MCFFVCGALVRCGLMLIDFAECSLDVVQTTCDEFGSDRFAPTTAEPLVRGPALDVRFDVDFVLHLVCFCSTSC